METSNTDTISTVISMIQKAHNPELAKQEGMVYQLWQDGELTVTKSGELLGLRNLHMIEAGFIRKPEMYSKWMHVMVPDGENAFIYCAKEDAYAIREVMQQIFTESRTPEDLERDFDTRMAIATDELQKALSIAEELVRRDESSKWVRIRDALEGLPDLKWLRNLHTILAFRE